MPKKKKIKKLAGMWATRITNILAIVFLGVEVVRHMFEFDFGAWFPPLILLVIAFALLSQAVWKIKVRKPRQLLHLLSGVVGGILLFMAVLSVPVEALTGIFSVVSPYFMTAKILGFFTYIAELVEDYW